MAWLTNWIRRKQIMVNGTTTGIQSDYQMKLTVNQGSGTDSVGLVYLGGHVLSDLSDLRFTASDESTKLYYWIESITGSSPNQSSNIWIKIGSIPTTGTTIYIYYDNSSPPSDGYSSSGINTFIFFDDFETYPLNQTIIGQTGWTNDYGTNNNNILVVNDAVYHGSQSLRGTSSSFSRQDAAKTINSINYDVFCEFAIRTNKSTTAQYDWTFYYTAAAASGSYTSYIGFGRQYDGQGGYIVYYNGSSYVTIQPYTQNVWYKIGVAIKYSSGKLDYWVNDVKKISDVNILNVGSTIKLAFDIYGNQNSWLDTARIRKYVLPEPTWGTSSTEQLPVNLVISSTPTGTEIWLASPTGSTYIDQSLQSNATITVLPGNYDLKLTLGGYQDYILSNQNWISGYTYNIQATLSPIPGSLSISSTPTGAEIYLGLGTPTDQGVQTIPSGTTISNLTPGTYNIRLTFVGYQDWTGTTTINPNSTTNVLATFSGSVYMTSTPSGAEIYLAISGNLVDQGIKTPSVITNLTSTSSDATIVWNYKLTLSGYADTSGSFTATAGSTITVPITFPGSLYITSIPTGASIYIDNVLQ